MIMDDLDISLSVEELSSKLANFGDSKKQGEVELSIRKKFHKKLFSRFAKGINE